MIHHLALLLLLTIVSGCGTDNDIAPPPVDPSRAASLEIIGATEVTGVAGEKTDSLRVRVLDQFGRALPRATVTFGVIGMPTSDQAATDTNGMAVAVVRAPAKVGKYVVQAITPNVATPALFMLTVGVGPAFSMIVLDGANQVAPEGEPLPNQIVVKLVDAHGNAIPAASVLFNPAPESGSALPPAAVTTADGQASTVWKLGRAGTNRLHVVSGRIESTVTATAAPPQPVPSDVTPPVIQSVSFSRDTLRVTAVGDTLTITVRVTDDISGVRSLTWQMLSPSGNQSPRFSITAAGTSVDKTYTIRVTIPPHAESGRWVTFFVWVSDASGNTRDYSALRLQKAGFRDWFWVKAN